MSATTSSFTQKTTKFIGDLWDTSIVPTLSKYIEVPNASPAYDKEWATNGHMDKAVEILTDWVKGQHVQNLHLEVLKLDGRTPLVYMTVPASTPEFKHTVFLYGHLDKQPPFSGWNEGLGPYKPVIRDGKLYGRGGADDGYAIFSAIGSIKCLQEQGIPYARYVIIIEASEESGSPDLPFYLNHLKDRIGTPDFIICLDSGCMNYEQLWLTTSLRGIIAGDLHVQILKEGVHSGKASGIVPSSFRILRQLLNRLEDLETGEIKPKELHVQIPPETLDQVKGCAEALGEQIWKEFPLVDAAKPVSHDPNTLLLNRNWQPTLSITGVDGIPNLDQAGNVLRPYTTVKVSVRLPPTLNAQKAADCLKNLFEKDPPYNAKVEFKGEKMGAGFNAPALAPWLDAALTHASNTYFGKPVRFSGEGGSIPFMGMLLEKFPEAQFAILGLLGPESNAHGPNEMLVIDYGKKLTCCIVSLLADHHKHRS